MNEFYAFLENFLTNGLEYFRKFYGAYRGKVIDNRDPEKRGRIKVVVPAVGHREAEPLDVWVDPAMSGAGANHGMFWPPEINDSVWVMFEHGNASYPNVYWGGWYGAPNAVSEVPEETAHTEGDRQVPRKRGFVTRRGLSLVFDDDPVNPKVAVTWRKPAGSDDPATSPARGSDIASITIDETGSIVLVDKDLNKVTLKSDEGITIEDKNSNKITLSSAGIEIDAGSSALRVQTSGALTVDGSTVSVGDGASEPIPLGMALMTWLNTHTHIFPATPIGAPTSPPVLPMTPLQLSSTVKVKR